MSRRTRRDRAQAQRLVKFTMASVGSVVAVTHFDFMLAAEFRAQMLDIAGPMGRARKADGRKRRARVAKRLAARKRLQHYPRRKR